MKKGDLPVVHCTYCNTEKSISEILEESFRLYLGRILVAMEHPIVCLLYTSPSPRDGATSRMPSSA